MIINSLELHYIPDSRPDIVASVRSQEPRSVATGVGPTHSINCRHPPAHQPPQPRPPFAVFFLTSNWVLFMALVISKHQPDHCLRAPPHQKKSSLRGKERCLLAYLFPAAPITHRHCSRSLIAVSSGRRRRPSLHSLCSSVWAAAA